MPAVQRNADADWKGNLEGGHGLINTESKTLVDQRFSFGKRTDQESTSETNPEELLGATAASCFAMALSKTLQDKNLIAETLRVKATVSLNLGDEGPKVDALHLRVEGMVPMCSKEQFDEAVAETQKGCPIYRLLEPGFETIEVTTELEQ